MSSPITTNNKRIAKNTLMLYVRMLLIMAVTLYTSRVVLQTLGVEDFGIYNVVAGVVVLFAFVNNAMATATQRFLNFEIGRNDDTQIRRVFSMSMTAHISISILIIILAETVGLWFLLTQMNIPIARMNAAIWCYQLSVLTTCIQIVRVPYNACIIAYERMSFYAYISIAEVVLRLLIVYLLLLGDYDRLVLYSFLMLFVAFVITLIYKWICNRTFAITHYRFFWDSFLYKRLLSFSGWSLLGNAANVGVQQGSNILINLFHGVIINSAVGISNQVTHAVYNFVSNFQIAFNPPLVKSYATNDLEQMKKMIYSSSKFSYFLLLIVALPLFLFPDFFLQLWLRDAPVYSAEFSRLMLLFLSIEALAAPLWITVQASGLIKKYQLIVSLIILMNLPISYVLLKMDYNPTVVFYVRIVLNMIVFFFRLLYVKGILDLSLYDYFFNVLFPILIVDILSMPLILLSNLCELPLLTSICLIVAQTFVLIYFVGLSSKERSLVVELIKAKISLRKS